MKAVAARSLAGLLGPALLVTTLLSASPAWADAIDGDWCYPDGRRFSIRGPEIVTPAGMRMQGRYSRHSFSYLVPQPEPNAGLTVHMILENEDTVRLC